jgi:predicted ArsR family transcriptional regulator
VTPGLARSIADQLGVQPNTVRLHFDALIADGRIERVEPDLCVAHIALAAS